MLLLMGLAVACSPFSSTAQPASNAPNRIAPDSLRRATLADWVQSRRLRVLDRSHGYGGWMFSRNAYGFGTPRQNNERQIDAQTLELYDRGVFQHLTPDMDREYALDMWAYQFSLRQAFRWHTAPHGVRMYAGSIERTTGAVVTDVKQAVSTDGNHGFEVQARLQQDAVARRALVRIGYQWDVGQGHAIGAHHTFAEYKADLDAQLYYQYQHASWGRVRAGLTFQNLYNDFLYGTLGVSVSDELLLREYGRKPFLGSIAYVSPPQYALRGEVYASGQPLSEMRITAHNTPDFQFQQDEQLYFVAGLLEYALPFVTTGVFYQRDMSRLHRVGSSEDVRADYTTRQTTRTIGTYVLADWWKLQMDAQLLLSMYRDRQTGTDFGLSTVDRPVDFRETRRGGHLYVRYTPAPGWPFIGVNYLTLHRPRLEDSVVMTREWTGEWLTYGQNNDRLAVTLGYDFGRGSITLGVGYDTDQSDLPPQESGPPPRFDNGFGRLIIYW